MITKSKESNQFLKLKIQLSMKTLTIFLLGILMVNCSGADNDNEVSLADCDESTLIYELTEKVPVTINKVKEGEPFYNGSKIYYELDVESHLSEILEKVENRKTIRIFPVNNINNDVGSEIMIGGKIISCFTGNHGLLTNNYIRFYLLEQ
jgi:hypothetical protein